MGAIEAFDGVLFQARLVREAGIKLDTVVAGELRDARSKAQHSLGPTVLHAPEEVRHLIRDATLPRMRLATMLLDPVEIEYRIMGLTCGFWVAVMLRADIRW
jgi:hypothetical protein